jgi:hypothetical protein
MKRIAIVVACICCIAIGMGLGTVLAMVRKVNVEHQFVTSRPRAESPSREIGWNRVIPNDMAETSMPKTVRAYFRVYCGGAKPINWIVADVMFVNTTESTAVLENPLISAGEIFHDMGERGDTTVGMTANLAGSKLIAGDFRMPPGGTCLYRALFVGSEEYADKVTVGARYQWKDVNGAIRHRKADVSLVPPGIQYKEW